MRKFADLTIKWKLTLIILLTSGISLLLAVSAFFIYDLLEFKRGEIEELGVLAEIIGENCAEALLEGDKHKAYMTLSTLSTRPRIMSAVLTDEQGIDFADYRRRVGVQADQKEPEREVVRRDLARSMDVSRRVVRDGRVIGRITIQCHIDFLQRNILQYAKITTLIYAATIFAALLLSLLLQRLISRPIKRITNAAQRISKGEDYTLQVVKASDDEIGALVESFNEMLTQIHEREEELRKHREHLEELVDQRAAVIKQTNDELRKEVWERKRAQHALVRLNEELEDRVNERTRALQDNLAELQKLSEALERERNLFMDGPVVVFKWKAERGWPVEYVSSNVDQLGYEPEDLISGRVRFQDIIYEKDREAVLTSVTTAKVEQQASFEQDYRVVTGSGDIKWIYCYIVTVKTMTGEVSHYDGYMLDMTERRNMQMALRESEQRLGLALKATNDVLWDWDFTAGSLFVSEKWCDMLGYGDSELPQSHADLLKLVHADDLGYIRNVLDDHIRGKTGSYEAEYRLQMKDGEYKWIFDRGRIVEWIGKGRPKRMIGTYTDITGQKVVELQISLQRALLKSMINSIPDLIFYKDLDGVYLGCNPAFCQFVGRNWDNVVGKSDYELFDNDLAQEFRRTDELMLEDAKPRITELWVKYPDGRNVLLSTLRTPYYGPSGETLGVVGISRDVTAHRKAEQELAEKQAQLVHSGRLAALGEMSTAIAHELGQPLQIIKTSAGIVREDLEDLCGSQCELIPIVDKVLQQVMRAATIIHNVRAFARQDNDSEAIARIDLRHPIDDALSFFKEQFRQHQVRLDVSYDDDLPTVRVNAQKFQQVIVNLLSNARYAVDQQGEQSDLDFRKHVGVRLYLEPADGERVAHVILEVSDNGLGMDKFARDRCLDPFFTTKPVGEGTGLGLSILYGIVKDFDGDVGIASEKGEGTTFKISVPVRD